MVTAIQTADITLTQLLIIFQAKAATLTIAQGFSLAYQSWQAAQVPARRGREVDKVGGQEADKKGNIVVTEAVVEKQPDDADEPVTSSSAGDLCCDCCDLKLELKIFPRNTKTK